MAIFNVFMYRTIPTLTVATIVLVCWVFTYSLRWTGIRRCGYTLQRQVFFIGNPRLPQLYSVNILVPTKSSLPYPTVLLNPQQHLLQVENKSNRQCSYKLFSCNCLSVLIARLRLKRKKSKSAVIKVYKACSTCYHTDNRLTCRFNELY